MNFETYIQNLLIGIFGGLISGMAIISYGAFALPNSSPFITIFSTILITLILFLLIGPLGWWIIKKIK